MKALTGRKFEYHRDKIGVKDNPFIVESVEIQKENSAPTPSALSTQTRVGPIVLFLGACLF